jgi:putative Ca2+/H+ antiporter (TMEM165/GDT1 family)
VQVLISSASLVAVAEMGDKTQLLALMLAAHYGRALPIILGITLATTLNHLASAWLGQTIGVNFSSPQFSLSISIIFIAIGLWLLKPDKHDTINNKFLRFSPFVASFIAFFLAEIGDKTQLATMALASEYQALLWVTLGTTIGMLIANIPAVLLGEAFIAKIPMKLVRNLASLAFIGFGAFQLIQSL